MSGRGNLLFSDSARDVSSTWGEGGITLFDGILNDDSISALTFREACKLFEGLEFYHGPSESDRRFTFAVFRTQIDDCYDFVDNLPADLKNELKDVSYENLVAINGWTRDICYVILSRLRAEDRNRKKLEPVLPCLKLFVQGLHQLPERLIVTGDLFRAEMGVRTNWDQKIQPGRAVAFITPLSFSSDASALKDFFVHEGTRTFVMIRNGIGYDISALSAYKTEKEVVSEGICCVEVERSEKYDASHPLVRAGQVKAGLHYFEAKQIQGIEMLSGSPVRRKETRIALATPAAVGAARIAAKVLDAKKGSSEQHPTHVPSCATPGCHRGSWNGEAGQTCCRSCASSTGVRHGPRCNQKWEAGAPSPKAAPSPAPAAPGPAPAATTSSPVAFPSSPFLSYSGEEAKEETAKEEEKEEEKEEDDEEEEDDQPSLPAKETEEQAQLSSALPSSWAMKASDSLLEVKKNVVDDPMLIAKIQQMVNETYRGWGFLGECPFTRDRRNPLATSLKVEQVVHVANAENYLGYCRRREEIRAEFGRCLAEERAKDWNIKTGMVSLKGTTLHPEEPVDITINEFWLWHGTGASASEGITDSDFDLARASKAAGTMFGRGIYLTESCMKADEYTRIDMRGWCPLVLSRVTLGRVYHCDAKKPYEMREELEDACKTGGYHSILGDREKVRGTFRESVIFDNDQVYPEYIVWYSRTPPIISSRAR